MSYHDLMFSDDVSYHLMITKYPHLSQLSSRFSMGTQGWKEKHFLILFLGFETVSLWLYRPGWPSIHWDSPVSVS